MPLGNLFFPQTNPLHAGCRSDSKWQLHPAPVEPPGQRWDGAQCWAALHAARHNARRAQPNVPCAALTPPHSRSMSCIARWPAMLCRRLCWCSRPCASCPVTQARCLMHPRDKASAEVMDSACLRFVLPTHLSVSGFVKVEGVACTRPVCSMSCSMVLRHRSYLVCQQFAVGQLDHHQASQNRLLYITKALREQ